MHCYFKILGVLIVGFLASFLGVLLLDPWFTPYHIALGSAQAF